MNKNENSPSNRIVDKNHDEIIVGRYIFSVSVIIIRWLGTLVRPIFNIVRISVFSRRSVASFVIYSDFVKIVINVGSREKIKTKKKHNKIIREKRPPEHDVCV